ncbi:MAG TPA: universal stress protein [Chryseolinea sp.]|nr:universal stress protein [Chryseolinea sp.]
MKRILVPCDFSAPAQEAFTFAANIALQNNNSEVHVLYVLDKSIVKNSGASLMSLHPLEGSIFRTLEDQWNEKFVEMRKACAPALRSAILKIEIGSLIPTIQHYIQHNGIHLVVMGTRGASGLKELFFGSKTEKIVRYSKVPVIAVPTGATIDAISNIVFPVAPSLCTEELVREIKEIQYFFRAKLHILWVNTPHLFKSDAESTEDLLDFAELYQLTNYTLNIRNEYVETDGILRFAKELPGSLITMPTHGRQGMRHFLNGSITENVVNHVHCPVWTYSLNNN